MKQTDALAVLTISAQQLAEIRSIPKLLDLRNKADALRDYLKASGDNYFEAARIKLMTEREIGKQIRQMQESGELASQGRPEKGNTQLPFLSLDDIGITKMQSSRFQREAELSDEEFDSLVEEFREAGRELTQAALVRASTPKRSTDTDCECGEWDLFTAITKFNGSILKLHQRWPKDAMYSLVGKMRSVADEIEAGKYQGGEFIDDDVD